MGGNILDILSRDNETTRLLRAYEKASGAPVEVRLKPWWLRLVSGSRMCVALDEQINWHHGEYERDWEAMPTMSHEIGHEDQKRRPGAPRFTTLQYAMPQLFAVLALLAFWHWAFLFALLFLLPWPSPWRAEIEAEAYAISRKTQRSLKMVPRDYSDLFVSWKYWFMSWSRTSARKRIEKYERRQGTVDKLVVETLRTYP